MLLWQSSTLLMVSFILRDIRKIKIVRDHTGVSALAHSCLKLWTCMSGTFTKNNGMLAKPVLSTRVPAAAISSHHYS